MTRATTISDAADVRKHDVVTLASDELGASVSARATDVQRDDVIQPPVTTIYLTLGVMGHSTPISVGGGCSWTFVSATRELPDVLPGTAGHATVRGEPFQTVMRCQSSDGDFWTTPSAVSGARQHRDDLVVDFVPFATAPTVDVKELADVAHDVLAGPMYEASHAAMAVAEAIEVYLTGHGYTPAPATVTIHQPAPEPEPEWKPGTTGRATLHNLVSGLSSVDLRAMRTLRDGVYGFAFANGLSIADDATTYSVSDFVPDAQTPAREHLAGALANHYGDRDNLGDADLSTQQAYLNDADAVLALLRGESL